MLSTARNSGLMILIRLSTSARCYLPSATLYSSVKLENADQQQISYAVDPLFVINQFCAKFSLLFLFHRIFWVNKTFVRWIYAIGIVHISYSIACLCIYFFSCRPISKSWDVLQPGTCVNYNASVAGLESINSGVDLAMVILAVLMVRKLHISKSLKIKLAFLFGLGSL